MCKTCHDTAENDLNKFAEMVKQEKQNNPVPSVDDDTIAHWENTRNVVESMLIKDTGRTINVLTTALDRCLKD